MLQRQMAFVSHRARSGLAPLQRPAAAPRRGILRDEGQAQDGEVASYPWDRQGGEADRLDECCGTPV